MASHHCSASAPGRVHTGWHIAQPDVRCARALCIAPTGAATGGVPCLRSRAAAGRGAGGPTGLSLRHGRHGRNGPCALRMKQRRALSSARKPVPPRAIRDTEDSATSTQRASFWERLAKAWKILFPPPAPQTSNADLAKERLRLVLYSDRGEVSAAVRDRLRQHIIDAISSYVEITDEDEVQLSVAADASLGAVYSVTIPVRRVKPEFQEYWSDTGFRDRFYEEILREQAGEPGVARIKVETRMLEASDD